MGFMRASPFFIILESLRKPYQHFNHDSSLSPSLPPFLFLILRPHTSSLLSSFTRRNSPTQYAKRIFYRFLCSKLWENCVREWGFNFCYAFVFVNIFLCLFLLHPCLTFSSLSYSTVFYLSLLCTSKSIYFCIEIFSFPFSFSSLSSLFNPFTIP